jgi:glycosyltransferase involved in cell wall biosynthesis
MRILIVSHGFAGAHQNPGLLDDLAVTLAGMGDEVDIVVHDAKFARSRGRTVSPDGTVRIESVGPSTIRRGRLGKLINHTVAGFGLHRFVGSINRATPYDLCIYASIGILSWGAPARLRRTNRVSRLVFVLWDFFPIHHRQIGRIKARFFLEPLRRLEGLAMKDADRIAVMSPANETFLRRYHPRIDVPTVIVPPWSTEHTELRDHDPAHNERFTVIFGGQLVEGRGVDTLIRSVAHLRAKNRPIHLAIAGDGHARTQLVRLTKDLGSSGITFLGQLSREEYRTIMRSVHVGVAITVPHVTSPTFPSKIVEYCAAGVPAIVCVEESSDAGDLVEGAGAGIAARAGDVADLSRAIETLFDEHRAGTLGHRSRRARELFTSRLSVHKAAEALRSVGAR